jgi:hypothetical protein
MTDPWNQHNPFAPVPATAMNTGGNPFDPLGSPPPPPPPAPQYGSTQSNAGYEYGAPAQAPAQAPSPGMNMNMNMNTASGTPQSQQYPPQQQYGQDYSYGMQQDYSGMQQQPPQQPPQQQPDPYSVPQGYGQQPAAPTPEYYQQPQTHPSAAPAPTGGYYPYSAGPGTAPAPVPAPVQNQLVASQHQSNPYGGIVAPAPVVHQAPAPDYGGSQSIVPSFQQASQWGVPPAPAPAPVYAPGPTGSQPSMMSSGPAGFDPFAPPPAAPPAPPPPAPAPPVDPNFESSMIPGFSGQAEPVFTEPPAPAPVPAPQEQQIVHTSQAPTSTNTDTDTSDYEQQQIVPRAPAPPAESRNPYSSEISRQAPPGSSPLPKANLVRKSGYVLSRISFRTIVMKKWKQAYWVQYGSHTMLWFRSQGDFDDWVNNPFHTQSQRNFLIKLAVNFVHDLYKPNVRGYQVTQSRVKPYGNKMVRQFKLERWMDYGPTIAAAFGSYDPKEVDALRDAIVECMRNTPLDGGIRATGAVRQFHELEPGSGGQGDPSGADHSPRQIENGASDQGQKFSSNGK